MLKDHEMYINKIADDQYKIGYIFRNSGKFMVLTKAQMKQLFDLMYNDKEFNL